MNTNLERFNFYLRDIESPQLFIDWTFYAMISAVLSRKVSLFGRPDMGGSNLVFPNQFVVLVADPGIGKSIAANQSEEMIKSFDGLDKNNKPTQLVKLGPSSTTLEAMLRYMNNHYDIIKVPKDLCGVDGKIYTFSSLALLKGEELGTLFKEDTHDLVTFITEGWGCRDFSRDTKTQGSDMVKNMCLTLLGACTPDWIQRNVSSKILSEGFAARTIFVYGPEKRHLRHKIVFDTDQLAAREVIRNHIKQLATVYGEVKLSPKTDAWLEEWYLHRNKPLNDDKRLKDYYSRKRIHLYKLGMAVHFADSVELEVTIKDFEIALDLLARTEQQMHSALAGSGTNPLFTLAQGVLEYLKHKGKASGKRLLLEFFDEAPNGLESINAALEFLTTTNQIVSSAATGEVVYAVAKGEEKPS